MDQAAERKRQVFSIPNIMSMFRIALIPLFASALLRGRTAAATALIALSALTDVADGFVARRFHMVTQLGKVLDPIADKLTLIVLSFCLALQNGRVWLLLGVMAVKEGAMLLLCALFLRKGGRAESACWYGKVTTALLYASEAEAKRCGAESLELMVWSFNKSAMRFYESVGMTVRSLVMKKKL